VLTICSAWRVRAVNAISLGSWLTNRVPSEVIFLWDDDADSLSLLPTAPQSISKATSGIFPQAIPPWSDLCSQKATSPRKECLREGLYAQFDHLFLVSTCNMLSYVHRSASPATQGCRPNCTLRTICPEKKIKLFSFSDVVSKLYTRRLADGPALDIVPRRALQSFLAPSRQRVASREDGDAVMGELNGETRSLQLRMLWITLVHRVHRPMAPLFKYGSAFIVGQHY
jgi:hypothetical protein